jgi:hypothetical protein
MSPNGSKKFLSAFEKRTDLPAVSCVANFYDSVKIIVDTYEKFETKPTGEQVRNEIYQIKNFDSAIGGTVTVDKNGMIDAELIRAKVVDGKIIKR